MSVKKSKSGKNYKTSDLGIGAYLVYQHINLMDVDGTDYRRLVFVFDIPEEEGMEIQRQWWDGVLKVEPRGFFIALTRMKDLIHSKKREINADPGRY